MLVGDRFGPAADAKSIVEFVKHGFRAMAQSRNTNAELTQENVRLRAQVAQLEDKLDHLAEHGKAARASQEAEALHREVMSVVSDAVLIADDAGRLTYVSPNAHFIFGYAPADILKQGRIGFLLPGDLFDRDVLEQRGEIANIECQIRDAVGRARNLLVTVRRVDRQGGTVLYACRDVTERKRIQLDYDLLSLTLERRVEERTQELRESRERYRRLVEGLRDEYLFYATDAAGHRVVRQPVDSQYPRPHAGSGRSATTGGSLSTRNIPRILSWKSWNGCGLPGCRRRHSPPSCCTPTARSRIMEFTRCASSRRRRARDHERRDRAEISRSDQAGRGLAASSRATGACASTSGLRELTLAMEQLRESEHRYRSVVEDQLEFIIRWRDDGVRTFVNDSYCSYCGAARDELIGESFMPSDRRRRSAACCQEKLAEVSVEKPVVVLEHRVEMPDGRIAWQHWSHRALFNQQGKLVEFQSVGRDITERRRREEHERDRAQANLQMRSLTDRERDVMRLVVAGDANKIIARKLDLSIKTIEKHRSSLMKKLHVRSVPELVKLALLADGCHDA